MVGPQLPGGYGMAAGPLVFILLSILEILHQLNMYYTTRIPLLLVYEVYRRPCRISIMNSKGQESPKYSQDGLLYPLHVAQNPP